MPDQEPIAFDAFQKHLARITHLDPTQLTMETNSVVDLGLDSLKILEMVLEFEKLGFSVSSADAWGIQAVQDAWEFYQQSASARNPD